MGWNRSVALLLGVASVACSGATWVALAMRHLSHAAAWNMSAGTSMVLWAAAALLAAVAARIGSRRWLLAALLPVANLMIFISLVKLSQPQGH